jgi:hypothetical protein
MEVRRTVKAALLDETVIPGCKCCIFHTFAHDDPNHLDLYKMLFAQDFLDIKVTDSRFLDAVNPEIRKQQGMLMSKNPVLSTKFFIMRLYAVIHFILNGKSKPLGGSVTDMLQKIEVQRGGGFHAHLMVWLDMASVIERIKPFMNKEDQRSAITSLEDLLGTKEGVRSFASYLDMLMSGDIPHDPHLPPNSSALDMYSYCETGNKRRTRDSVIGECTTLECKCVCTPH